MSDASPLKYRKLQGRRILILGASSGMGFGIAQAAVEEGAEVILSSSRQEKLDRAVARLQEHAKAAKIDAKISAKTCDLSDAQTIEANIVELFKFATQNGKLDHVATTAGDTPKVKPLNETTIEDFYRSGLVREVGSIMLAKHLPEYVNASTASSLTLTSGANSYRPGKNWSLLAGIGAGIEGLARGFAVNLRPIRVNCVVPGAVHTELFDSFGRENVGSAIEHMAKDTLVGHLGKAEDLAESYIYLMKNRFANGTSLIADGGRQIGHSRDD